jgi:hypothetical protein
MEMAGQHLLDIAYAQNTLSLGSLLSLQPPCALQAAFPKKGKVGHHCACSLCRLVRNNRISKL